MGVKMNSMLNNAARFLVAQSLQIVLVFLVAFALCWLLRNASAHWRYLLWLVVIVKCLTPPIFSLPLAVLPPEISKSSPRLNETRTLQDLGLASLDAPSVVTLPAEVKQPSAPKSQQRATLIPAQATTLTQTVPAIRFSILQIAVSLWILLATLLLAIVGARMWATQRRLRRTRAPADEESRQAIAKLAKTLGLRNIPQVYEVDSTVQPFVWGWLRGDIYLPLHFSDTDSAEEQLAILTHELAHVSRWDAGINHLQNFVQAIFFFHPLIWWANRRLRQEREKCCDEIVLSSSGASPKVYCGAIVAMLTRECASRMATPALAVTGSTKNIKERLITMLTPNRTFLRRPSLATVVTMLLLAAFVLPTALVVTRQNRADEQKSDASKIPVKMKPFKLRLMDGAAIPIEGVKVEAVALRWIEEPSGGCLWPTDVAPQNEFVTDKKGEIELEYPVKSGRPGELMTTSRIFFRYKHADFVSGDMEIDPTPGIAQEVLLKGCRTVFRCKDTEGAAINEFAVQMVGKGGDAIWNWKNGVVSSGGVPEGDWQTLLVAPSADGLHRFSDLLLLAYKPGEELSFDEIELRAGMNVRGSLSDNVPRPIKNGSVIAWCLPKPAGESYSEEPSLGWEEQALIAADGTFEFPSLPRGGKIQFIALCDGWVVEGMENGLHVGKEIMVEEAQLLANHVEGVVLPMEQAGSVEVDVLGPDGKPLVGASVFSWPNQLKKFGGATLFGHSYPTVHVMESQISGVALPHADLHRYPRYTQKTDEKGKASLREIPIGKLQTLAVSYESLTMQFDKNAGESSKFKYVCKTATPKKLTIRMERISDEKEKPKVSEPKLDVTMNKPNSAFDVSLLTSEEMLKVFQERTLSVSPQARKAILDYAKSLETTPAEFKTIVERLRDGADALSLHDLTQLLQDRGAKPIAKVFAEDHDPIARFAARCSMTFNGDADSAPGLYDLIHDHSLSQTDRQVICSWCNGVGIRLSDSPSRIVEQFASATSKALKFKMGEVAPDFEVETVSGLKLASTGLRGKVVVLHFWSTSCGPCIGQMPSHISSLVKHDQKNLEVLFVSLDDDKEKFIEAVKQFKIPFKNIRDERGWGGELARQFGVNSMPFDVIIDGEGKIASYSIEDISELLLSQER